jgi:hypothetical protein
MMVEAEDRVDNNIEDVEGFEPSIFKSHKEINVLMSTVLVMGGATHHSK